MEGDVCFRLTLAFSPSLSVAVSTCRHLITCVFVGQLVLPIQADADALELHLISMHNQVDRSTTATSIQG